MKLKKAQLSFLSVHKKSHKNYNEKQPNHH